MKWQQQSFVLEWNLSGLNLAALFREEEEKVKKSTFVYGVCKR